MNFDSYQGTVRDDVSDCLNSMGVQPILFVGSGLSQRYYGGPSWNGLLSVLADLCPMIDRDLAYYQQKYQSPIDIGTHFADSFREWAWGEGRSLFPDKLFQASAKADIYIKHTVASHFEELLNSDNASELSAHFYDELEALKRIRPHAIITTNYDRFLEQVFPDYSPVIGERILRANYASVGEIYKIHGCSSDPTSIVLTRKDFEEFEAKKKYLSAKLLTFFNEHPLVFIGYSAEDPNIKAILSDIDEILAPAGELIPNIYVVEWQLGVEGLSNLPRERLIAISPQRSVRIKKIVAEDFTWIYDAFRANEVIEAVNPKLLRSMMARMYSLVRHDISKRTFEIDYQTLQQVVSTDSGLARLFGITTLDDPSAMNAAYPYSLTQVGEALGYRGWHGAHALIQRIKVDKGVDIKSSDNKYHFAFMMGNTQVRKYSEDTVELLARVRDEEPYDLRLQ